MSQPEPARRQDGHKIDKKYLTGNVGAARPLFGEHWFRINESPFTKTLIPALRDGYAVTSHSSQGAAADRVLVHVDTEQAHDQLVNSRLAYVSVSRGRYDAQIYTNNAEKLGEESSRDFSKQSAMETGHEMGGRDQGPKAENAEHLSVSESQGHGQGYGVEH